MHQALYLWTHSVFPNKLLNFLGDRSEMAHSVEGRTPFLDHPLVELVTRMPAHVKIRGMTEKWVLREAARPFLTDTVYKRQKHPFFGPPQLKGRILELMRDTFASRILDEQPFFEPGAVRARGSRGSTRWRDARSGIRPSRRSPRPCAPASCRSATGSERLPASGVPRAAVEKEVA